MPVMVRSEAWGVCDNCGTESKHVHDSNEPESDALPDDWWREVYWAKNWHSGGACLCPSCLALPNVEEIKRGLLKGADERRHERDEELPVPDGGNDGSKPRQRAARSVADLLSREGNE